MTSLPDMLTSSSPDVNISSNVTMAAAGNGNPARRLSPVIPIIVRVTILLTLNMFNLCGNGFTLLTIRYTPRLWTKTNFILASMLVAIVMTGVLMLWYTPFILVVYAFNNPCHYNVVITALTPVMKITPFVSNFHLILISVERYIAIVYPLHYETMFTDRTLKRALSAVWIGGIFIGLTYALWLINADLQMCSLIPEKYHLVDVVFGYFPVCPCLLIFYGKILMISRRHRQRIGPQFINVNVVSGSSVQTKSVTAIQSSKATSSENAVDPKDQPMAAAGPSTNPVPTGSAASAELTQQQRQKIKSRGREFKAVYLTAAIVGAFFVLWFPYVLGRVLASVDNYNPVVVNYINLAGGAIGSANFGFAWAIYAAVSRSYRRAYRQMLIRIGCCCWKSVTLQADNSLIV